MSTYFFCYHGFGNYIQNMFYYYLVRVQQSVICEITFSIKQICKLTMH